MVFISRFNLAFGSSLLRFGEWACNFLSGPTVISHQELQIRGVPLIVVLTLPKTTIAPENGPLEKEIPIGNQHFKGQTVSFREGKFLKKFEKHPQELPSQKGGCERFEKVVGKHTVCRANWKRLNFGIHSTFPYCEGGGKPSHTPPFECHEKESGQIIIFHQPKFP